jgi:hypothetical protein
MRFLTDLEFLNGLPVDREALESEKDEATEQEESEPQTSHLNTKDLEAIAMCFDNIRQLRRNIPNNND